MPIAVPSWTTVDGKIFTSYIAALKHELFLWLSKAGDNEVGARSIVSAVTEENIDDVVKMFSSIAAEMTHPTTFTVVVDNNLAVS